ncbi:MAG: PspA/IM30 family protein [Thermoleophilia bacterium]
MSFFSRLKAIFQAKANKALDAAEKPDEMLDYSFEKQTELLTQVRRGVADVATSKKRLELQADKLQQSTVKLEGQASAALAAGREDLARTALERKAGVQAQLDSINAQKEQLQGEQDKLVAAEQKLTAKIEAFRVRKETIKAQYTAAEAQTKIGEAFSGISEDMADVGMAMDRAESKVETMRARAGAIDELLESGALDDLSVGGDVVDRELSQIASQSAVEADLARLKGEIGAGAAPAGEIGTGGSSS